MQLSDGEHVRKRIGAQELATLSALAINTDSYISEYLNALAPLIGEKSNSILDTACGVGFPTLPLLKYGYFNVTACDGSAFSLEYLKERLREEGLTIRTVRSSWDNISQNIKVKFDCVLNIGNSFVYMDGWGLAQGESESTFQNDILYIQKRCVKVIEEFRRLLNDEGRLIIGLAKHYDPKLHQGSYNSPSSCVIRPVNYGEDILNLEWTANYDWDNRILEWKTSVESDLYYGEITRYSYLITKEELADFMRTAGFGNVEIVNSEIGRDNFVVGVR